MSKDCSSSSQASSEKGSTESSFSSTNNNKCASDTASDNSIATKKEKDKKQDSSSSEKIENVIADITCHLNEPLDAQKACHRYFAELKLRCSSLSEEKEMQSEQYAQETIKKELEVLISHIQTMRQKEFWCDDEDGKYGYPFCLMWIMSRWFLHDVLFSEEEEGNKEAKEKEKQAQTKKKYQTVKDLPEWYQKCIKIMQENQEQKCATIAVDALAFLNSLSK